jgi:hypothetical protein
MNQTTVDLQTVRNVTQDKEDSEILDWLTPEEYGTDQSNKFRKETARKLAIVSRVSGVPGVAEIQKQDPVLSRHSRRW